MAIEPIKGFYVHDEASDTDGVAKYDFNGLLAIPEALKDITAYCAIANGTPPNSDNVNAVRNTNTISAKQGQVFTVYTNRPISDGGEYHYGFYEYNLAGTIVKQIGYDNNTNPMYACANSATVELRFSIAEFVDGTVSPLRTTDFANYSVWVERAGEEVFAPNYYDMTGLEPILYQKDRSINVSSETASITPVYEANWSCCLCPCSEGDVFSVKGYGGSGTRLYAYLDEEHNVISRSSSNLRMETFYITVAPDNAAYFIANSKYTEVEGVAFRGNALERVLNRALQFYFINDTTAIEEDRTNKIVYLRAAGHFVSRFGDSQYMLSWPGEQSTALGNDIAEELGTTYVTSPKGLTSCIAIPDDYTLVFDIEKKVLAFVERYSVLPTHIVLVANNSGYAVDLHPYFQKIYTNCKAAELDAKIPATKTVPEYWESAVSEAETSINNYLSAGNSASFAFVTDTHIGNNKGNSGVLLKKVMNDCYIPAWFHGGDAVTGQGIVSKETLIGLMKQDFSQFESMESRCVRVIGNHEPAYGITNNYDHNLTNPEIDHYYFGVNRDKDLFVYGDSKRYFYKDIPEDKTRLIALDINDYESAVDENGAITGYNKLSHHVFGLDQLAWLAEVLNSTPDDYLVVVCSHMVPVSQQEFKDALDSAWTDSYPTDYLDARGIVTAYKNKTTYTATNYTLSVDFSNANGDIVCWIGGHSHRDCIIEKGGVDYVVTANDSISVSTSVPSYTPPKTSGTNTEHVLDFFCINKDTKTVNVVRLGAYVEAMGKVRQFSY